MELLLYADLCFIAVIACLWVCCCCLTLLLVVWLIVLWTILLYLPYLLVFLWFMFRWLFNWLVDLDACLLIFGCFYVCVDCLLVAIYAVRLLCTLFPVWCLVACLVYFGGLYSWYCGLVVFAGCVGCCFIGFAWFVMRLWLVRVGLMLWFKRVLWACCFPCGFWFYCASIVLGALVGCCVDGW